jgi:hypothetical protein
MTPILLSDMTFANALVLLAGVAIVSFAALKGWRDWISLKREELAQAHGHAASSGAGLPHAASRIELADLKERLRKLEAIAAGVDL